MNDLKFLEIDSQTIEDLRIFGKGETLGIFDYYNHTHTRGGEMFLKELFRQPLSDRKIIGQRIALLKYLSDLNLDFPFESMLFDSAEKYISVKFSDGDKFTMTLTEKDIHSGVTALITLFRQMRDFIHRKDIAQANCLENLLSNIFRIIQDSVFEPVFKEAADKVSFTSLSAYDRLFRIQSIDKVTQLLQFIYELDAFLSIAKLAAQKGLSYPTVEDTGTQVLQITGLYHPEVKAPVANDILLGVETNLVFLTGANMAGKSTFLRSVSTALYLAHMGFPVAATSMSFSVLDGLYTTINLPDNLGTGASHFYAEVLRVKKVAKALSLGKSLFVVFDELFRGTNVKDAKDATVEVALAFSRKLTSRYIISSHIVEAAEDLKAESRIQYMFLPTRMNGTAPEYTYKLEKGVTDDRHGMIIIRNEGILALLEKGLIGSVALKEHATK